MTSAASPRSVRYAVRHETNYRYGATVSFSHSQATLLPRDTDTQSVEVSRLTIHPEPADLRERTDAFGNRVVYFSVDTPTSWLEVVAESELVLTTLDDQLPADGPSWEEVRNSLARPEHALLTEFVLASPAVDLDPDVGAYAAGSFPTGRPIVEAAADLCSRVHHDIRFDPYATDVTTSVNEVFHHRHGVCQDLAHLMISGLRSLGLAARYVSGYIETEPAPGEPKLIGSDASHAWVSLWTGDDGWLDLDPTNDQVPVRRHLTVAHGRDYSDVTPVKGVVVAGGSSEEMSVAVDVRQLARPTTDT